jgi:hypothetical protein
MKFDKFPGALPVAPDEIPAEVRGLFISEQGRGFLDGFHRAEQMSGITHAEMINPMMQAPAEEKGEASLQMPQADPERVRQTAAGIIRAARKKFPRGDLVPKSSHNSNVVFSLLDAGRNKGFSSG